MIQSIYFAGFANLADSTGSGFYTFFSAGWIGCNCPFTPRMLLAVRLPGEGTAIVLHHIACPCLIAGRIERCSRNFFESIFLNFRCISVKCDVGKTAAFRERVSVNYSHAVRDVDAGQATAAIEHRSFDTGYTIRDTDAGQATAAIERVCTNAGHAVRDIDTGQATAAIERICTNAGHAVRDDILSPKAARYLNQG